MYPKTLSRDLSRMLDTLYSKFWAVTRVEEVYAAILPQAPPTLELMSNAFQRWYMEVGLGIVPTSRRTQSLDWRMGPKALK